MAWAGGIYDFDVFPTGVGMNRRYVTCVSVPACVPHGCGDEPSIDTTAERSGSCSPRVWG